MRWGLGVYEMAVGPAKPSHVQIIRKKRQKCFLAVLECIVKNIQYDKSRHKLEKAGVK